MTETSKHKQPTTSEHPYIEAPRRVARPIRAANMTVGDLTKLAQGLIDMGKAQIQIAKIVVNELVPLNALIVPAIDAVRTELNLPIDNAVLHDVITRFTQSQVDGLNAFTAEALVTISTTHNPQPQSTA
jgi:hypothetical protein